MRFKFRYLDKIESDEEGVEAFMGSRVHDTLEKLYGDLRLSKTNTLDELQAYFDEQWDKSWHDNIVIVREEFTLENYRDTGKRCIANYYNRHSPFDRDITVSLEERLQIPVDDEGKYVLVGYVDRISRTGDHSFEIHDYKSGRSLPSQETLDSDRQLSLYQIGVKHKWPDSKDFKLIWHYVAMDADMVSVRSEEDLEDIKREVVNLIDEIESATEFPPKESALCAWCDYQDICPTRKHPSKVEKMPVNEFKKDSGVQLVNKYMDAVAKKKKLQDKISKLEEDVIDKVEDALFSYAEKENVQIIQGRGYKLNLKIYRNHKFPPRKDEEFNELVDVIRGSPLWDDLVTLDTFALDRKLKEGSVDEELREAILKLARIEEARRIYVRRD
jgi:putative RecB family exonuclease